MRTFVSIPFKRESTCEREDLEYLEPEPDMFQFPSNGKARVNDIEKGAATRGRQVPVSIPFKRESTCERV